MGALIIESNELNEALPEAAYAMERAIESAVRPHPGAFFASLFEAGDQVLVQIREHVRTDRPWKREVRFAVTAEAEAIVRRVDYVLRIRGYVASRGQSPEDTRVMPETEVSAWPVLR